MDRGCLRFPSKSGARSLATDRHASEVLNSRVLIDSGGSMLRAHACVICGDPIPAGRRVDRRYCRMSCRSVAYRARKGAKQPAGSTWPEAPDAALRPGRYGAIPGEVLDILAKHFGQRDDGLRAERTAVQRQAAELERALNEATAAPYRTEEETQAALLAAQDRIRKLTAEHTRSQLESADQRDKLTTKLETLSRQKQADTDALNRRGEALQALQTELKSAKEQLAKAAEQTDSQSKQLEDLQRNLEQEKHRASQLEALATARERAVTELQEKQTAAEARATLQADKMTEQTTRLTGLEQRLAESEQQRQSAQNQEKVHAREHEETQRQLRSLQAHAAEESAAASQRLAAMKAERDQLQAECSLHRERAEPDAADPTYDAASAQAIQMLRKLLESQAESAALHAHMQHFGVVISWSARWFARQFVRVLLGSERQVDLSEWATTAALDLRRQSLQNPAPFPEGMPEWTTANPELVAQLALCVAGSAAERILGTMPAALLAVLRAPAAPHSVWMNTGASPGALMATAPLHRLADPEEPHLRTRELPAPLDRPPDPGAPAPSTRARPAPGQQSMGTNRATPSHIERDSPPAEEPQDEPPPPAWPEPAKPDRLVGIQQDLLSVSHQLAELQDIVGRPITARRLREGVPLSEQALEEAMAERWNYIRRPPPERTTPVFWVRHGAQFDEQSERELRDRATDRYVDLSASLRILQRKLPR